MPHVRHVARSTGWIVRYWKGNGSIWNLAAKTTRETCTWSPASPPARPPHFAVYIRSLWGIEYELTASVTYPA